MPAVIQRYRKILACGCSHGDLADRNIQKQVLAFKRRFKPDICIELGDLVDTAAFRTGARGTPDESKRAEPDEQFATRWLQQFEPSMIFWGNHDWRLVKLQHSPNAIVSYAAGSLWNSINDTARKLKAKTYDYNIKKGWAEIGGVHYGHGYMYGVNALRDHSEMVGGSVVMAHLHAAQQINGRMIKHAPSYCTGSLADIPAMEYAQYRRATLAWSHGVVWGYAGNKSSQLYLTQCDWGGELKFPI